MKKKFVVSTLSVLIGFISVSIVASIAWFSGVKPITSLTGNIAGAAYAGFFHSGDGTENAPFEITAPEHYKNLITLQNENESFANTEYYFRFGSKNLVEGQTEDNYSFYGLNNDKTVNYSSKSNTLDLNKSKVTPIGTPDKPFIGHIVGNNLTVSKFIVNGEGRTDIGIFGYVGQSGTCSNLYFDDFTIDAGNTSIADSEKEGTTNREHIPHANHNHKDTSYIGYLAGHILYAENFTDVYVNNCDIVGKNVNKNNLNNYSYYGMVDNDVGGGSYGGGSHYEFTLDAPSVYNYLNSRYSEISTSPMRLRNSGYADEGTINAALFDKNDKTQPIYPVSDAIKVGGDWISGSGYDLVGKGPTQTTTPRSYSLSTLGYFGAEYETNPHNGIAYYKDGGTYKDLPFDLEVGTVPLESSTNGTPTGTDVRYYDANHWTYYKTYNYISTATHSITFKLPETITSGTFTPTLRDNTDNNATFSFYFYLDTAVNGASTQTITRTVTGKCIRNSIINAKVSATFKSEADRTFTFNNIPAGVHHYAVQARLDTEQNDGSTRTRYFALTPTSYQNYEYVINKNEVNLNTQDQTITITGSQRDNANGYTVVAGNAFTPYVDKYGTNLGPYDIYIKEGDNYVRADYRDTTFTKEISYEEDGETVTDYEWNASYFTKDVVPNTEKNHYIAGTNEAETDPAIQEENERNQIYASGYRYNNIDIVGGDINFGARYITFRCSRNNQALSPTINNNTYIGKKFYPTEFAPNSVVMYLKNVGGSKPEDSMGNIEFNYGFSILGNFVKDPIFRCANGANDYFDLSTLEDNPEYEGDYEYNRSGLNRTVKLNIRRKAIKRAAYCALDKDGNILCGYKADGTQTGYTGEILERDIDCYVLIFSVRSITNNIEINTRVSSIKFSYDAINGYGGTFGSVGFRSAEDADNTVESTILNFYVFADSQYNISYYVKVEYDGNKKYLITFKASDTVNLTMTVFLYDSTYSYSVNGGEFTKSSQANFGPTGGYSYSPPSG